MRIDLPARRQRRLSLTPLIDVIFLLLLFFMLSSTFSRYAEVRLSGGGTGAPAAQSQADAILSIGLESLRLNGEPLALAEIGPRLEDLREAGAGRLLVLVGADAASQDFVAAMAEISRTGMPVSVARRTQ